MSFKSGKSRDSVLDATDACQAALLGLNETVVANHEWFQRQFAELNAKLDAIMQHLGVPYEPPAGLDEE